MLLLIVGRKRRTELYEVFILLTPRPVRCLLFEIFRGPKIGEELAYWQRAKGAPGRAFVLDVKRAFLVAKKAGAEGATPEAPAVPMEVDKAAAEERTRSLSATPLVMLFSMLSFVGGVATRLPLLLPLAAMMMIWMPRLLGVQGKLGAAENERTAEARASRGAEEEGARAMVVAGLSSKLLLLLSATADSAMLHSLGIALEPNSPKEEEPKTPRPSRPNRHRKRIRRRINALHRRKVRRRRKLARRRRLRRRRELWGRAKLRCSGKPIGGSRRRQKRGIARRNADDAVRIRWRCPVLV